MGLFEITDEKLRAFQRSFQAGTTGPAEMDHMIRAYALQHGCTEYEARWFAMTGEKTGSLAESEEDGRRW